MWGRYQLLEMIGEGSFGAVYRAWDPQLESELAIKILHQKTTDERLKANLLAEGRALARIDIPTSCACSASRRTAIASDSAWTSSEVRRWTTSCGRKAG